MREQKSEMLMEVREKRVGPVSTGRKALETTGESNGSNFSFRTGSASLRRLRGKWGMGHSKDR